MWIATVVMVAALYAVVFWWLSTDYKRFCKRLARIEADSIDREWEELNAKK